MNCTLRTVGTPAGLRNSFSRSLSPLLPSSRSRSPEQLFTSIKGVESWNEDGPASYVLTVSEPRAAAPGWYGVSSMPEQMSSPSVRTLHSLEDVYLELIADDVEALKQ